MCGQDTSFKEPRSRKTGEKGIVINVNLSNQGKDHGKEEKKGVQKRNQKGNNQKKMRRETQKKKNTENKSTIFKVKSQPINIHQPCPNN